VLDRMATVHGKQPGAAHSQGCRLDRRIQLRAPALLTCR
jgi:hypothetical protein